MPGALLITAGADQQRALFAREGRVLWSDALPLVLEKHGYLDVEVAEWEVLSDPDRLREHDVLLVAELPPRALTAEVIEWLAAAPMPTLMGARPPEQLRARLGLAQARALQRTTCAVDVVDAELQDLAGRFGAVPGGSLAGPVSREMRVQPELLWSAQQPPAITPQQADAWRADGWGVERWSEVGEGRVLCVVRPDRSGDATPAVARFGELHLCCFDLFARVAQAHSAEPVAGPEWRAHRPTLGLEALLLGLVDLLFRRARADRLRVLPWPGDIRSVRVLRHDVVQPLDEAAAQRAIAQERAAGVASTWFWAPSAVAGGAPRAVACSEAHEVALSAEHLWTGDGSEIAVVAQAAGTPVRGTTARASGACVRYQGAPNVLWAEQRELDYVEVPARGHLHPHRFAALRPDGELAPLEVICVPGPESLAGHAAAGRLESRAAEVDTARGLMQLAMPADQDPAEAIELLGRPPDGQALDWTLDKVVSWWRQTHTGHSVSLVHLPGGRAGLTSLAPAAGVCVEVLAPDGSGSCWTLDVDPLPRLIGDPSPPEDWSAVRPEVEDELQAHWSRHGGVQEGTTPTQALAANTVDVPDVSARLLEIVTELTQVESLEDLTILDLTGGFATLACYLALRHRPYLALSVSPDTAAQKTAQRIVRRLQLESVVELLRQDQSLSQIEERTVDLVLLREGSDAFRTRHRSRDTLKEIRRVLRPWGHVVLYGAPAEQAARVEAGLRRLRFGNVRRLNTAPGGTRESPTHAVGACRADLLETDPRRRPRPASAPAEEPASAESRSASDEDSERRARSLRYHSWVATKYFERWEQPVQRLTTRLESRWLKRALREIDEPRVLLAGSGGARELPALLRLNARVVAVDYSEAALAVGRERWGAAAEWRCADVHDLSDLPADFDAVVSLAALNYFADLHLALSSLTSRLRPGGLLLATVLNAAHPTERRAAPSTIVRHALTYDEMTALARNAGLDVLWARGERVFVDRLLPAAGRKRALLLSGAIATEPLVGRVLGPRRAKWMWLTCRRRSGDSARAVRPNGRTGPSGEHG